MLAVGFQVQAKVVATFTERQGYWFTEAPSPDCLTLACPQGHSEHEQALEQPGETPRGSSLAGQERMDQSTCCGVCQLTTYTSTLQTSMSFISKLWQLRPHPLLNAQFHLPKWIKKLFSFSGALGDFWSNTSFQD